MAVKQESSKIYFKSLFTIFLVFVSALLMMSIFALILRFSNQLDVINYERREMLSYIAFGIILWFLWKSRKSFRNNISNIKKNEYLVLKTFDFRYIHMIFFSKLILVSFTSYIGMYYLGEDYFLILPAIVLIIYITHFPGKKRMIKVLNLNNKEIDKIMDPNAIICELATKQS